MDTNIYKYSNNELIQELGKRFKEYRQKYGKSQKDIAGHTGLSIFTISSFESGSGTGIIMVNFLKLLRSINELEQLENILPELPTDLYARRSRSNGKKR